MALPDDEIGTPPTRMRTAVSILRPKDEGLERVKLSSSGCRCEGPLTPAVQKYGEGQPRADFVL
jgi:hypothetical protein